MILETFGTSRTATEMSDTPTRTNPSAEVIPYRQKTGDRVVYILEVDLHTPGAINELNS